MPGYCPRTNGGSYLIDGRDWRCSWPCQRPSICLMHDVINHGKPGEPTGRWMVRGTVVFPTHQGSSPGARIYSWIYFRISSNAHSVGGDVPVDDEVPTVTRKFQDDMLAQSFGGAHRGRVCVCAFIGVSVCACI
jgi:hypothetical protein